MLRSDVDAYLVLLAAKQNVGAVRYLRHNLFPHMGLRDAYRFTQQPMEEQKDLLEKCLTKEDVITCPTCKGTGKVPGV